MLRFTVVCFLLAGFLLAPLAAKARLRDETVVTEAAPNQNVPGNGQRNVVVGHREDGQFLNAIIDDVRIWDRVLEDDEIAETMASPLSGLAVHPDGSLAWKWGQIKVGH